MSKNRNAQPLKKLQKSPVAKPPEFLRIDPHVFLAQVRANKFPPCFHGAQRPIVALANRPRGVSGQSLSVWPKRTEIHTVSLPIAALHPLRHQKRKWTKLLTWASCSLRVIAWPGK
jgi:hypothetical protein